MKNLIIFLLIFFISPNCFCQQNKSTLKQTIKNYPELEAVIKHYKKKDDNEKLKAVNFLIANIGRKGSYMYDLVDSNEKSVGYNISNFKDEMDEKKGLILLLTLEGNYIRKKAFCQI